MTRELIISDRLRALCVIAMMLVGLLFTLLITLFPGVSTPHTQSAFRATNRLLLPIMFLGLAYEGSLWWVLTRALKTGRVPHLAWKYATAFIEVSLPSVAILTLAPIVGPVMALNSLAAMFYLVFILFSTMRLNWRLCVFTGVLAGVQYCVVAFYLLPHSVAGNELASDPIRHVLFGSFFAAAGVVAGGIAQRIRSQSERSVRQVEERNRIVSIFGQHVSPAVVDRLLHQDVEVQGEVRHVCVMFLDIRNFTPFAEQRSPEEVVKYLNTLFGALIETVNKHNGIVNKFLGDGFLAVFGAPIPDGQDCRHAVDAALEIVKQVRQLNESGTIPKTSIGIGLHAGDAVTGNVGSQLRREYTIIGNVVNLASRLEQLNKEVGSQVLASEEVCSASSAPATELGPMPLKGQQRPVRVFQLA